MWSCGEESKERGEKGREKKEEESGERERKKEKGGRRKGVEKANWGQREQHQAALAAYRFDNGPLLSHE